MQISSAVQETGAAQAAEEAEAAEQAEATQSAGGADAARAAAQPANGVTGSPVTPGRTEKSDPATVPWSDPRPCADVVM